MNKGQINVTLSFQKNILHLVQYCYEKYIFMHALFAFPPTNSILYFINFHLIDKIIYIVTFVCIM